MAAPAQLVDFVDLKRRVTDLDGALEKKELLLQMRPGLDDENAAMRSQVERMRSTETILQLECDVVLMVMDEFRTLRDKTKNVVTEMKNLKKMRA